MGIWGKMKDLFLEKEDEPEEDLVEELYQQPFETRWIDGDVLKDQLEKEKKERQERINERINLEKEEPLPEPEKVAVQINGSYEYRLEENMFGARYLEYRIDVDLFDIFIIFYASINCTVDEYKLTIPAHYKIHVAGGKSEEEAYLKLAQRTEEEEREFMMDELKPRIINDIKAKISEERYKQIKKQVEEKGKVRFDVVMDIDKDKLTK